MLSLTTSAKDGRSYTLTVYENNPDSNKQHSYPVYADERNQENVEKWINLRMKKGIGFGSHLRFKAPTLSKYFPTKRPPPRNIDYSYSDTNTCSSVHQPYGTKH